LSRRPTVNTEAVCKWCRSNRKIVPSLTTRVALLFGISIALFCHPVNVLAETTSYKPKRTMFGIELRQEAIKLLKDIEQHFGKNLQERSLQEPDRFATAGIDADGTPYIAVNKAKPYNEGIIVHELFHLKLWAEGYPSITFEYPTILNVNEDYANWLWNHLYDPIEHSVFYPKMRKMKLDPGAEHRSAFEEALSKGDYGDLHSSLEHEGRTLHYVEATLHLREQHLLERLRHWYKTNKWDESLRTAEEITARIKREIPLTSKMIIPAFVDCLNILKKGIVKFELNRWEQRKRGRHTEVVAVIRILPKDR
jgi:hypothetical protein